VQEREQIMSEFIQAQVNQGVAVVTLNRPPLNVLNLPMLDELHQTMEALAASPEIAAIVIRGAGKAFSAGVDVADHSADKVQGMLQTFHGIFRMLAATDALTIAAVNGAALGGGCEVACFCDVVLASEKAKFAQPEVKVGVFPPVAACILPLRIGVGRAIEFNALGETIDAAEAQRIGLATRTYPAEQFEAQVEAYIKAIAKLSRPVVRLAKRATAGPGRAALLAHLDEAEALYLNELMTLADAHEGLAAFLEKRAAAWRHA
jgi:cyclohexa-1,5-dienecarbonyl-CoA hydratase